MIKAICDYCGKDLGRVMLELVHIEGPPIDECDTGMRRCIPYYRPFKLRGTNDVEQNHYVACGQACAEMLDGDDPKPGVEFDPSNNH